MEYLQFKRWFFGCGGKKFQEKKSFKIKFQKQFQKTFSNFKKKIEKKIEEFFIKKIEFENI